MVIVGNVFGINDGVSVVIIVSESVVKKLGLIFIVEIMSYV